MSNSTQNDSQPEENNSSLSPADVSTIEPPPEVRYYVERTALLVSKKGSEFEKSMMSIQERNPEFRFFRSSDRYHEYYKRKLAEYRAAKNPEDIQLEHFDFEPQPPPQLLEFPNVISPTFYMRSLSSPGFHVRTGIRFHIPTSYLNFLFENIKLAAPSVARDGYVNPEFEFMRPTDFRFNYFDALAAAYSERKNDPFATSFRGEAWSWLLILLM